MFELVFSVSARKAYERADGPLAKKLDRCFALLEQNPHHHSNVKRLTGRFAGKFRFRVGDWRVIYSINGPENRVAILLIEHRSDVYD